MLTPLTLVQRPDFAEVSRACAEKVVNRFVALDAFDTIEVREHPIPTPLCP